MRWNACDAALRCGRIEQRGAFPIAPGRRSQALPLARAPRTLSEQKSPLGTIRSVLYWSGAEPIECLKCQRCPHDAWLRAPYLGGGSARKVAQTSPPTAPQLGHSPNQIQRRYSSSLWRRRSQCDAMVHGPAPQRHFSLITCATARSLTWIAGRHHDRQSLTGDDHATPCNVRTRAVALAAGTSLGSPAQHRRRLRL